MPDENANDLDKDSVLEQQDSVQVFCRLLPFQDECEDSCVKLQSTTTLTLTVDSKFGRKECSYGFRHIFSSYAGQREVFEHVALPLLEDLIQGKNGLLFAYGVSGSGKTYTLTGEPSSPGIMPRCINVLFNSIEGLQAPKFLIKSDKLNGFEVHTGDEALRDRLLEAKASTRQLRHPKRAGDTKPLYDNDGLKLSNVNEGSLYSVFISYIEIYNNVVYDLLDESSGRVLQSKIMREDSQKNMFINGVVEVEVKTGAEAFELFCLGQKRKRMGCTVLNTESSRSHSIFNIRVVQLDEKKELLKIGQLSLVDLAGSERCGRTQTSGVRLKEASAINNSLMSLRTCLEVLREIQLTGGSRLVPYRDSRLTLLFKNYFEGGGQVRMVVCINPSIQDCEENLQVLKFAEMSQDVKVTQAESRHTPFSLKTPKSASKIQHKSSAKTAQALRLSFGPVLPHIHLEFDNPVQNEVVLDNLIRVLQTRKRRAEEYACELTRRRKSFRDRLLQLSSNALLKRTEIRSLKALLKKEKLAGRNLATKAADLEAAKANLSVDNKQMQEVICTLRQTIAEKDMKINQNSLERAKEQQKMALQCEKMNRELDEKLRLQRERLQTYMQRKDDKLQRVKEILESDTVSVTSDEPMDVPKVVQGDVEMPSVTTQTSVAQPRYRRSRSVGEVWLEHNAVKPVPLGTVLQPSMKKSKCVTKLKRAADITNPKQTKYCLIAQEPVAVGELETKIYKGDIIGTCGGGAQVIFNDVECLRQESPMKRN